MFTIDNTHNKPFKTNTVYPSFDSDFYLSPDASNAIQGISDRFAIEYNSVVGSIIFEHCSDIKESVVMSPRTSTLTVTYTDTNDTPFVVISFIEWKKIVGIVLTEDESAQTVKQIKEALNSGKEVVFNNEWIEFRIINN